MSQKTDENQNDDNLSPTVYSVLPSQHLQCPVCRKLYVNPVINVHCGHTFCKKCAFSCTHCPLDGNHCDTSQLVVNRLVIGQIEDLEIYCKYGLIKQEGEYVPDPSGCQAKLPLGKRGEHESQCEFIPVPCPNNPSQCGKFRKGELEEHQMVCPFMPCSHRDKGCEFVSQRDHVTEHMKLCGYRGFQKSGSVQDMKEYAHAMEASNRELQNHVRSLTDRVQILESQQRTTTEQLQAYASSMQTQQKEYEYLQSMLEQLLTIRNRRSVGSPSNSAEGKSSRSSSFKKSLSGSPTSTQRIESWLMPFQFKCIGTLRGHQNIVWCLANHRSKLFSSGADSVIKIWDLENLAQGCIKTLKGHNKVVHTMCVVGDLLYTGGDDLTLRVWNIETGAEVQCLQNAHDNIISAMNHVGDYLFTSSFSLIKVWDAKTLALKHTIAGLYHWVRAMAIHPDKDRLYSGSHNTIDIWDVSGTFSSKGKVDHQFGSVYSLAVTAKYLIAGTYNRNIQVFDLDTKEHVNSLRGHIGTITDLTASPSGRFLFSSSTDSSVKIWNLENFLPIQTLQRHEGSVNALILIGDYLMSGSADSEIKVFRHFQMQMGFACNT
ncbi:hypothetical protein CHS0354_008662 [Potamilus streckersoni]|uniref:Uncharacterized protein n=1 Tax=Potamilus streckersoni TaxID=2493646 RepID=A0AAE0WE88_9BIVA|nr:hypothetical protein CHS0354_008662 [Potamilus streckersoni]